MNTMREVGAHRRGGPDRLIRKTAPRAEPRRGDMVRAGRDHVAHGLCFVVEPAADGLDSISKWIRSRLSPDTDRVVSVARTRVAYEALEKEYRPGKAFTHVARG
ncbi:MULTISPECIES: hypothetical protein [unclassified Streptomyces]|uniref:hypothetical protein n=1 Tax=unclassified Streptomyces TaxID=2593676 RepID=UPI003D8F9E75